jgi:hypothetical protein
MLLLILVSVTVVLLGNDNDVVSHLNLACALIGILFALLVIIYTLIDGAGIRSNLNEMNRLFAELRGDVGKTTYALEKLKEEQNKANIVQRELLRSDISQENKVHVKKSDKIESYSFDISKTSNLFVLANYIVVQSFRREKNFILYDVIKQMYPEDEENSLLQYSFGCLGMFVAFQGVAHREIRIEVYEKSKIEEMPIDICDLVDSECKKLVEYYSEKPEHSFMRMKQAIDDYFTAS